MDKYYMVQLELNSAKKRKLTYHPDHDKIYLFDKNGIGYDLLDKSAILPPNTNSYVFPLGHYVDPNIYKMYLQRTNAKPGEV